MIKPIAPVFTMAAVTAMNQAERTANFAACSNQAQSAFINMGKLYRGISAGLTVRQTIYGELRKVGVKDGTISNAGYASKVFDLVEAKILTEADFDKFTFADCLSIVRSMSAGSKVRQTPQDIAARVKKGKDFQPDLEALYSFGMTAAEKTAADKAAAATAETDKATKAAATEAEKQKTAKLAADATKEVERLKKENAALVKNQGTPAPAGSAPAPAAETAESAATPNADPTTTTVVHFTPPAPKKRTAADLCEALDAVFSDMAALPAAEQAVVAAKIVELAGVVADAVPKKNVVTMPKKAATPKKKAA